MGDVYIENEISEMPLAAYNDTVWNTSLLFDSLGFYSSMDDIFTRLLTLASYISRRFIQFIEDLVVRDADRYSDDLLVISAGQHLRSLRHGICKSFSEGCSSSSKPCNPETCERRASEPTEDTRSEIVETNFNYTDVPFIFKGLTLPLHGLQFAWRLAISCWRSSVVYVRCAHLRIFWTWQVLGSGMKYSFQFPKICHVETRRWLFLLGVVAVTYLSFQSLLLPYGNALRSLLPHNEVQEQFKGSGVLSIHSSAKSVIVRNPLTVHSSSDFIDVSMFGGVEKAAGNSGLGGEIGHGHGPIGKDVHKEIDLLLEEKGIDNTFANTMHRNVDHDFPSENAVETIESVALLSIETQENGSVQDKANAAKYGFPLERIVLPNYETSTENTLKENSNLTAKKSDGVKAGFPSSPLILPAAASLATVINASVGSTSFKSDVVTSKNGSVVMKNPGRKKMKSELPPKSITSIYEMNHILVRHRASSRSLRPRWSSVRDQDILAVKSQIEHPPVAINDRELYAPLFRNVSMFKRSYELMERTLKIYIYKDGNKPIFHQPILKGLYASEGWFMKLMQGYKRFVVKDPRKAHLFYMPFSSRMLEYTLYVRNSHNRTNLRQILKEYSEKIAAKYPYWNRTGGADHFLVACHDWAPYETRHHMERCIKALCNADVTGGFKIGRDVSLPETYVRSARNPLRDLGGKPPSQRQILAFYAGNVHGYLRPILLEHWKDKDLDMKIFGPMPPGVASKMNYIQHMKSSKYCICPKGYEVNSPRVVEAIFYECVPVIISDNFVPPFFEVLDWGAFSVILAEKDIPNLKEILLSIPEEKYLQMQLGVRKVQKHFLWHAKPLKYDLFHMTLHSIWYNRVFQIKLR